MWTAALFIKCMNMLHILCKDLCICHPTVIQQNHLFRICLTRLSLNLRRF
uniref:Uncharacterized protein n=1 Tax=Anguilla anguilla TaxID=7936 RepID=A0A0E9PZ67_ANGAN